VIAEATRLFEQGAREINLIGQDTTCYGEDLGIADGLSHLLARLAGIETEREKWIRFLYAYPNKVTQRLLDTIAQYPALVKYIDMPLQHASARVLKRMKRGGSGDIFLKLIERVRRAVPGVAIRTSFIVGFPGETDEDVDELLGFMDQTRFDHVGVFTYSHEEGTSAYAFSNDVAQAVKQRRQRRLMSRQRQLVRAANRRRIGETVEVLVDGRSPEHDLVVKGRLMSQAPEIDPVVYLDGCDPESVRPGDFLTARLVATKDYDLVATPLASPDVA
jgi:ribosomal protein S12 methylthiotransferase